MTGGTVGEIEGDVDVDFEFGSEVVEDEAGVVMSVVVVGEVGVVVVVVVVGGVGTVGGEVAAVVVVVVVGLVTSAGVGGDGTGRK